MQKNYRCLGAVRSSCLALLLISLAGAPAHAANSSFNTLISGVQGDFNVWLPDDVPVSRGLGFYIPGAGGDTQGIASAAYYQQAARAMGFGFMGVGVHNKVQSSLDFINDAGALQRVLDAAATASGHPELRNAPVATMGGSAGG